MQPMLQLLWQLTKLCVTVTTRASAVCCDTSNDLICSLQHCDKKTNEENILCIYAGVKKEIVLLTEELLAAIAAGDYNAYT